MQQAVFIRYMNDTMHAFKHPFLHADSSLPKWISILWLYPKCMSNISKGRPSKFTILCTVTSSSNALYSLLGPRPVNGSRQGRLNPKFTNALVFTYIMHSVFACSLIWRGASKMQCRFILIHLLKISKFEIYKN